MNKKLIIFIISALVFLPLFLFAVTETEPNDSAGDTGVLTVENGIHDGNVSPANDLDFWGFEASEEDFVEVSTIGLTTVDTKLWIYAEDGVTELAYNDDSGGTLQSYVSLTVEEDGYYYFVVGAFGSGTGPYQVELSGASIPVHYDNDLQGRFITGNTTPTEGDATIYTITIKNQGNLAQLGADYTVELYNEADELLDTVSGIDLDPGEQGSVEATWTPSSPGATFIYGKTALPGDENTENDQTDPFNVNVQSTGTIVVSIGTGSTLSYQIPANFFYKSSLSECWYYPEEINFGGLITQLGYHTNWYTNLSNMPIRIWMGETTQPQAAIGWIPADELTLVFDGTIDLPTGEHDILFALDTFFGYSGADNLVIMFERPMDTQYYSTQDTWYNTDDVYHPSRTRHYYSDNTAADPNNPPAGHLSNLHPNIGLYFDNTPTGSLDGFVYGNDRDPLEGAMVHIEGTTFSTYTDETGYYHFPYVFVGNYDITASIFGYYDTTENVDITEDVLTSQDITLDHLPTVAVCGHVVTSDTGADVIGADVMLEGYDDYYDIVTDDSGMFTIPGVYADHTYTLTITYAGYSTYENTNVVVGDVDLDLGDIIVEEIAIPVYSIIAEVNHDGNAEIVWGDPSGTFPSYEISYDDGTPENATGWYDSGNMNAIKFTPLGYPCTIETGMLHIYDGSWPAGTILTPFQAAIYDDDGAGGLPGTELALIDVTPTDYNWVELDFASEMVTITEGDFYIVHIQGGDYPNCAPTAIDETAPVYRSYSRYVTGGQDWGTAGYNDFMIRAIVRGPGGDRQMITQKNEIINLSDNDLKGTVSLDKPVVHGGYVEVGNANPINTRVLESYDLFRLLDGDQGDPGSWTEIETAITDTIYIDTTWPEVAPGVYRYAVVAIYTNGVEAAPGFSNTIAQSMDAVVTINITTNSGDDPAGAMVVLTNQDEDPEHVYTMAAPTGGVVVFPEVWLGVYDLTVTLENFAAFEQNDINIFNATTIPVELIEEIGELGELVIDYLGNGNVHLTWAPQGASNVLLVDDDGSAYLDFSDTQANYIAVFDAMEIDYDIYDIVEDGADGPDAAYMADYDVVIWECGEQWSSSRTITATDEGNLADYIDGGGKVIVSAHDYLYDRYPAAGALSPGQFPYDYLGVASATQDFFTVGVSQGGPAAADLDGAAGSYVDGLNIQIVDIFSTRDGVYLDILNPNDMGAEYASTQGENVGVQTANTIFTTAGLGSVTDGDNTVLEWFEASIHNLFNCAGRSFLGYTITRNDADIATGVMEMEYNDVVTENGLYEYTVTGIYTTGTTNTISASIEVDDIDANNTIIPDVTALNGNYPNPFNPVTNISFSISEPANVRIDIYNIRGEKVKTLVNEHMEASNYTYSWNGKDDNQNSVASGVYFYKMAAGRYTSTKKMILMKQYGS